MRLEYSRQPTARFDGVALTGLELLGEALAFEVDQGQVIDVDVSDLVPVYSLSALDAVMPDPLAYARLIAWRSFVVKEGEFHSSVDYRAEGDLVFGDPVGIQRGALGLAAFDGLSRAEEEEGWGDEPFEVRILVIRSLVIFALWLRGLSGQGDVLITVPPVNMKFRAFGFYSLGEFAALLREAGNERLNFKNDL